MSLQTRLGNLITALGTDYKQLRTWITGSASGTLAGLATSDKTSLIAAINEAFAAAGGSAGATNLTVTPSATTVVVNSDTGTDATIAAADGTNAGVMTSAMQVKLAGIEALADVTDVGNIGSSVHGAAAKVSAVGADEVMVLDSAASFAAKRMTASNFANYISGLIVNGAPGALDTLDELAQALGDDANFASTVTTSLAGKQPLDTDLTAIAALTSAADKVPYATGAGTWSLMTVTSAARGLLDDIDVAAMRGTLSVYSQAELGDPETDLAALYATAKA